MLYFRLTTLYKNTMKNRHSILFVSCNGITDLAMGGPKGTIRNYKCLQNIGTVTTYTFKKKSSFKSVLSLVEGYYPPMLNEDFRKIKKIIKQKNIDIVFFDQSFYGNLVKKVKKLGCKTIVFFHNCESDYNKVRFISSPNSFKAKIYQIVCNKAEKSTLEAADIRVTFLQRDVERLNELYGHHEYNIIPLAVSDKFAGIKSAKGEKYCLLFGPTTGVNIEGVRWFVENVAEQLKCNVLIAGNGFDTYSEEFSRHNVRVKGFVEDMDELYANAFIVAIPLLHGAGMKVKTVEALMFGKKIAGSKEAYEGFSEEDIMSSGYKCLTANDYISYINMSYEKNEVYNETSRKLYLKKYSIEASQSSFDKLISEL